MPSHIKMTPTQVCRKKSAMAGTSRHIELSKLLRDRLKAATTIIVSGLFLFFLRGLIIGDQPVIMQFVVISFVASCGVLLYSEKKFSFASLRWIEVTIFGFVSILFAVKYTSIMIIAAKMGQAEIVRLNISYITTAFFALIVIYGIFIPNHWQRAALIVTPMALTPVVMILALFLSLPSIDGIKIVSFNAVTMSAGFMLVAAFTAAYGVYVISTLREEAYEARRIGRYQLTEKIGSGGMGEVWMACHDMLARPAAIKLIRQEALSSEKEPILTVVQRFEREARITAMLRSPHTIEIYDFGISEDNSFYYVMELLEGVDMKTLVKKFGPLPPERVIFLLKQMCLSLAEAHHHNLIHRDIKPANIYVCRMGLEYDFVKVLDFGLVKRELENTEEMDITKAGMVIATPAFIAPEMVSQQEKIDLRADIYALGCVAYWLCTGKLVFSAKNAMGMMLEHAHTKPEPPSKKVKWEIPEDLDRIILSCLEKDPQKRPQNMLKLRKMLSSCKWKKTWSQPKAEAWWKQCRPDGHGVPEK